MPPTLISRSEWADAIWDEYLRQKPVSGDDHDIHVKLHSEALKKDQGKPRWDILMNLNGLDEVVQGFTYGASKYADFNWREGKGLDPDRLLGAALRHIRARRDGLDDESGVKHLALAVCNLLMILDLEGINDNASGS